MKLSAAEDRRDKETNAEWAIKRRLRRYVALEVS